MPRPASVAASPSALPEYEPPSCRLSENACRGLGRLAQDHSDRQLQTHIRDAHRNISSAVGDLNEILRDQLDRHEYMRTSRAQNGRARSRKETLIQEYIARFKPEVDQVTLEAEGAVRDLIDLQAAIDDQAAVLNDMFTAAATQTRRAQDPDQDRDLDRDEEPPPPTSTLHSLDQARADKLAQYDKLTPHQRYGLNNDYISFKKIWYDSVCPQDGPPLPDARRWFRTNGQPVMDRPDVTSQQSDAADGSDDDVAVAREVLSVKCPLTLRTMVEPYSNKKCKHSFEKDAIREYIFQSHSSVQCPQTGCNQKFSRDQFDADFFLDQALLRRIQRSEKASGHNLYEHDEDSVKPDESEDIVV
ncbi:hypothetical protein CDD82_6570 [Ophiocordyceps australis]|uniref:SP-RING-type domain-containing protein n=1 Tax=Ophiocordyceps australis TaxID=1399860 RepID=A0A2C5ZSC5_9HYPO|nr:hypothetical protein CDD82_6570 [Ophiocordyceps australis]